MAATTARIMPQARLSELAEAKHAELRVVETDPEAKERQLVLSLLRSGKSKSEVAEITGINKFGVSLLAKGTYHGHEQFIDYYDSLLRKRGFRDYNHYKKVSQNLTRNMIMPMMVKLGAATTKDLCDALKAAYGYSFRPIAIASAIGKQDSVVSGDRIYLLTIDNSTITLKSMRKICAPQPVIPICGFHWSRQQSILAIRQRMAWWVRVSMATHSFRGSGSGFDRAILQQPGGYRLEQKREQNDG